MSVEVKKVNKKMNYFCVLVVMMSLLIGSFSILPLQATAEYENKEIGVAYFITTERQTKSVDEDIIVLYEGQILSMQITAYWSPPQPDRMICLWVNESTLPEGATFSSCNCSLGQITGLFYWQPMIGQAGTYIIQFFIGEACEEPHDSFTFTIIVLPYQEPQYDFGDAPENAIAYPSTGVEGKFPTCIDCGQASFILHSNHGANFGSNIDLEIEGNAGFCCDGFPPYDKDETFLDTDAGLIKPEPFTINSDGNVEPCIYSSGTSLGVIDSTAEWGEHIDLTVQNKMPGSTTGYVNVLIDWNQNGKWVEENEHVLVDFAIPNGFDGIMSQLNPPSFQIGSNPGYVWMRCSITERPVGLNWEGDGVFEDGETEDYLLKIDEEENIPDLTSYGSLTWNRVKPNSTITQTFFIRNIGEENSTLHWKINSYPDWGTWMFSENQGALTVEQGNNTIHVSVIVPDESQQTFSGVLTIVNEENTSDMEIIPVVVTTPKQSIITPFLNWIEHHPLLFELLRCVFNLLI